MCHPTRSYQEPLEDTARTHVRTEDVLSKLTIKRCPPPAPVFSLAVALSLRSPLDSAPPSLAPRSRLPNDGPAPAFCLILVVLGTRTRSRRQYNQLPIRSCRSSSSSRIDRRIGMRESRSVGSRTLPSQRVITVCWIGDEGERGFGV